MRARRKRPYGYTAADKCDESRRLMGLTPKAKDHGLRVWSGFAGLHPNKSDRGFVRGPGMHPMANLAANIYL